MKGEAITVFPITALFFITIPAVQFIFTIVYMTLAYRKLSACYRQHRDKKPALERMVPPFPRVVCTPAVVGRAFFLDCLACDGSLGIAFGGRFSMDASYFSLL